MFTNYHFRRRAQSPLSYGFIFKGKKLTQQGQRNRVGGKIIEESSYLFLHRRVVPIVAAAVAVAVNEFALCLELIAAVIRPPVDRVTPHCLLERLAHLRAPNAGVCLEQFMFN